MISSLFAKIMLIWYTYPNGLQIWKNTTQLLSNVSNSTSPIGVIVSVQTQAFPWFWPIFPFVLYLYLLVSFADSPNGGKLYMIAALCFIISVFLAFGSYISDAIINFVIFAAAFFLSNQFKKF